MKSDWSKRATIGLGLAIVLGSPSHANGEAQMATPMKCAITSKWYCSDGVCKKTPTSVWNQVDLSRKTYSRCDRAGCDTYGATISRSGAFETIEISGRGLLAKVGDDGTFLEVATLGVAAYVSHGKCIKLG